MSTTVVRVILNTEDDIFRDVALPASASLDEAHRAFAAAFDLNPGQMASFYRTDAEWNQGDEIPLIAMDPAVGPSMADLQVGEVLGAPGQRLLFVYDFLEMWSFLVEFVRSEDRDVASPEVVLSYGVRPETAPELQYGEDATGSGFDDDEFGDDEDEFGFDEEDLADGYSSSEDW
ncbi:MAG: IS1096 element passenger TnpR family protein [Schleiferiaceae bacterium]